VHTSPDAHVKPPLQHAAGSAQIQNVNGDGTSGGATCSGRSIAAVAACAAARR